VYKGTIFLEYSVSKRRMSGSVKRCVKLDELKKAIPDFKLVID